jgi:hypothetical protein
MILILREYIPSTTSPYTPLAGPYTTLAGPYTLPSRVQYTSSRVLPGFFIALHLPK